MDWKNHLEKKSDPKNRKNNKNQSEIAACEQKNHKREIEIWFKQKTRPRMNYQWIGKTI